MSAKLDKTASRFLGLNDEESDYEKSKYVILPVGYEQTTTFGKGTALGPHAIIGASAQVELYDEELRAEPYRAGIYTLPEPKTALLKPEGMVKAISDIVRKLADDGKFVVTLGGEHTVAIGPATAYAQLHPDLSILQIDAHADLRESYQGSRYSHACTMRRIRDIVDTTVGVGIRNISAEGADLAQRENVPLFYAHEIAGYDDWHKRALDYLTDVVYITIDLDGFDPSIMPGVGTPEPGGLGWYEVLRFLRKLCDAKSIVGFDVVELMPIPGSLVSEFSAAKLTYKLIGFIENSCSEPTRSGPKRNP
jgi:agmatinase